MCRQRDRDSSCRSYDTSEHDSRANDARCSGRIAHQVVSSKHRAASLQPARERLASPRSPRVSRAQEPPRAESIPERISAAPCRRSLSGSLDRHRRSRTLIAAAARRGAESRLVALSTFASVTEMSSSSKSRAGHHLVSTQPTDPQSEAFVGGLASRCSATCTRPFREHITPVTSAGCDRSAGDAAVVEHRHRRQAWPVRSPAPSRRRPV